MKQPTQLSNQSREKGLIAHKQIQVSIESNNLINERQCRICLSTIQTPDNQMVTPCNCSGSAQFVHEECLRDWLQRKNIGSCYRDYYWETIQCEVCKGEISSQIKVIREYHSLIEIKQKIKLSLVSFIIVVTVLLPSMGFFGFLVSQLVRQIPSNYSPVNTIPKNIIIMITALDCLLMFYLIYIQIFVKFFTKEHKKLTFRSRKSGKTMVNLTKVGLRY